MLELLSFSMTLIFNPLSDFRNSIHYGGLKFRKIFLLYKIPWVFTPNRSKMSFPNEPIRSE